MLDGKRRVSFKELLQHFSFRSVPRHKVGWHVVRLRMPLFYVLLDRVMARIRGPLLGATRFFLTCLHCLNLLIVRRGFYSISDGFRPVFESLLRRSFYSMAVLSLPNPLFRIRHDVRIPRSGHALAIKISSMRELP